MSLVELFSTKGLHMCFSVRLERESYILLHSSCFSPSGRFGYSGALTSPTGWNRGTNFSARTSCSLWDTTPLVSSAPWLTAVMCDKPVMFQHQLSQCFYGWSNGVSLASPVWNFTKMNYFFHQLCNNRLRKDSSVRGNTNLIVLNHIKPFRCNYIAYELLNLSIFPSSIMTLSSCDLSSILAMICAVKSLWPLQSYVIKGHENQETLPCLYPFSQGFCRHMSSRLQIGMWWDTHRCGTKETWQGAGKPVWSLHVFSTDRRTTHQWVTRHITPLLLSRVWITQYVEVLANKILCCHTMVLTFEWFLLSLVRLSCRFWSARWHAISQKISSSSGQKRYCKISCMKWFYQIKLIFSARSPLSSDMFLLVPN